MLKTKLIFITDTYLVMFVANIVVFLTILNWKLSCKY